MALAHSVPESVMLDVARKIEQQGTSVSPPSAMVIASDIAQPAYRAAVARFMNAWVDDDAGDAPSTGIAWGLRAAARTITRERAQESVELVWTGPNPMGTPLRRTDGALLEVINAAERTLTIVTFAAYKVPSIAMALIDAARRGVAIRVIIESAQVSEGKVAFEGLAALGPAVRRMAAVYVWPLDQRETDEQGRHGSLHVKCAVADTVMLLISSANLTQYALTLNMELGLLVRGGTVPNRVVEHLDYLIQRKVLMQVSGAETTSYTMR